jgi:2-succinyl-5-enolpyruvyl-6-hydroxy-3-cyclohexene-1-carboxylate synthase
MKHSSKKSAQILAKHLQNAGICDIVISPGSRNAPLIIEFTNQDFFNNHSVVDERSAGFFALGMAQQTGKPTVLLCSSGTALLNYHPAVAEAFYSKIPLIVVSADRPQKWIDHGEGQTIRQDKVLTNHTYFDTTLQEDYLENAKHFNDLQIGLAIKNAIEKQGPVHINIPFDEPLYDIVEAEEIDITPIKIDTSDKVYPENEVEKYSIEWLQAKQKMILVGQHPLSDSLQQQLEKLSQDPTVIVLTENISNVQQQKFINNIDQAIFSLDDNQLEMLRPKILLTIGRNIFSKKIKQFLRKHKPKAHWHIGKTDIAPNTFEVLTKHFNTSAEMFLSQFLFMIYDKLDKNEGDYQTKWLKIKQRNKTLHQKYLTTTGFSDLKIFELLSKQVPKNYMIQWGNSSTIRYAQLFDFPASVKHFSNRGASGIDGSSSTAGGAAYASGQNTLLVSGDISFLYDSNALWNKYIPNNFKIIVINNGGGDIFNFIPGPSKTNALESFFVTKHKHTVKSLVEMYNFDYQLVNNLGELTELLPEFFRNNEKPQILEICTSKIKNNEILRNYFKLL